MGRPPKPTAIRLLEGNRSRRPLPEGEPRPQEGVPACPEWLSPAAKGEYRRLTAELAKVGLVTHLDRALLVAHCQAWADLRAAVEDIEARGRIVQGGRGERRNPSLTVKQQANEVLLATAARFGLSPADRTRIKAGGPKKESDPLGEFLNSGKKA